MPAHAQKTAVRDMVQTTELTVTMNTINWTDALHKCGAVTVEPNGEIRLNPKVREIITALHTVLAGGGVTVKMKQIESQTFSMLEQKFELAFNEAKAAVENRRNDATAISPYVP